GRFSPAAIASRNSSRSMGSPSVASSWDDRVPLAHRGTPPAERQFGTRDLHTLLGVHPVDQLLCLLDLVRRGIAVDGEAVSGGMGISPRIREAAGLGEGQRNVIAGLCGAEEVASTFPIADCFTIMQQSAVDVTCIVVNHT